MFPNRSVVVSIGLLPGLVLVVASDRRSTVSLQVAISIFSMPDSRIGQDVEFHPLTSLQLICSSHGSFPCRCAAQMMSVLGGMTVSLP